MAQRPTVKERNELLRRQAELENNIKNLVGDLDKKDKELSQLRQANNSLKMAAARAEAMQQSYDEVLIKYDGTRMQLDNLAKGRAEAMRISEGLQSQRDQLETANRMLISMRDENAKTIETLRNQLFEANTGISERVAAAEGKAQFYKDTLTTVILALRRAHVDV